MANILFSRLFKKNKSYPVLLKYIRIIVEILKISNFDTLIIQSSIQLYN